MKRVDEIPFVFISCTNWLFNFSIR